MYQKYNQTLSNITLFLCLFFFSAISLAAVKPAPDRKQGQGPYKRLFILGANVIDGTGAPPKGPQDIVIEGNKIVSIKNVGYPKLAIKDEDRPKGATEEIDAHGMYVMPGFINMHCHVGSEKKAPESEYVYKLWMAHGITTARCVPAGNVNWALNEKQRSARNEITAPRIVSYHTIGSGEDWKGGDVNTVKDAKRWVKYLAKKGADGIKFFNSDPNIMQAVINEAKKQKLGTVAHLAQMTVGQTNAQDAARMGLDTLTH